MVEIVDRLMKSKLLEYSDKILQELLNFKEKNPDFTFSLRQRNSVQSKGEKRLEIGQWFQGSDYIYVPLFKRGDNDRKIKTVGFVITFNEDTISNYIEISFKANNFSDSEKNFHQSLADKIGLQLNENNHGIWHFVNQENYIQNLNYYINHFRELALNLLEERNLLEEYLISEKDFQKDFQKVQIIRNRLNNMNSATESYLNLLKFKKQIILQGPPGTGKTRMAVQLAKTLTGIKDITTLEESGQLKIVQFHPSYSYEDFVEGLKPKTRKDGQITFATEDGVFKEFCKTALISTLANNEINSNENSFDYIFEQYVTDLRIKPKQTFYTKNNVELIVDSVSDTSITVKYKYANKDKLKPGKRAFIVSKEKLRIVTDENIDPAEVKNLKTEIQPLVGHIAGELYAVYSSFYSYMKGHAIELDEVQTEDYDYQSALDEFKQLNKKDETNFEKKYVLIIDEMNRANLSTVLGELISLMEDGKRLGASEQMTLELPTSKEEFGIPMNLYIIGTMNTADRSVSHIDYAVRRRFAFVDVLPKDLIEDSSVKFDSKLFNEVKQLFEESSNFLSAEFNQKDVQLGHSYFIKKDDEGGSMALRLKYEIKPILMEYVKDGILRESAVAEIEALSC